MTAPNNVHISIIVCKGSPLDYQQYRHTAFWIQFDDPSTTPAIMAHITGTAGMFQFEFQETNSDPTSSSNFAKQIEVGFLITPATPSQLRLVLQRIPIDNWSREFNCQTWIERALKTLMVDGCISASAYERGLDGMVDAIAEAEDEEE